jgi:hypothetical protein
LNKSAAGYSFPISLPQWCKGDSIRSIFNGVAKPIGDGQINLTLPKYGIDILKFE